MAFPSYGSLAQTNNAFRQQQQQQPFSSGYGQQQPFSSGYGSSQATLRTPGLATTTYPGQIFGGIYKKKKKVGGRKSRQIRKSKRRKTRRHY
jgi:hypothetical protein